MNVQTKKRRPKKAAVEPPAKAKRLVAPLSGEPPSTASTISMIERLARDPGVDIEKLKAILEMQERDANREAKRLFDQAMNEAQSEIRPIVADAENKQTDSRFASYVALDGAVRDIYTKYGFSLSFDTGDAPSKDEVRVLCYVSHTAGHSRTYKVDLSADGKGPRGEDVMTRTHAAGSAMTFGQRYLFRLIFNLAVSTDDDGNAAPGHPFCITEEQALRIFELIEKEYTDQAERNAYLPKFYKAMKVTDGAMLSIKAADFGKAMTLVNEAGIIRAQRRAAANGAQK